MSRRVGIAPGRRVFNWVSLIETGHFIKDGLVDVHPSQFWYDCPRRNKFGRDRGFTDEKHLGQLIESYFEGILQGAVEVHTSGTNLMEITA